MAIKYKWLANKLKEQMKIYHDRGIDKLPSENELCKKYKVSRQTVRQALSLLEADGLIEKRQGSGSFYTGLSLDSSQNVIGLLFPSDQEYDYPNLLNALQLSLEKLGFHAEIYITNYDLQKEREYLTYLLENPIRGIIVEGIQSALPNPNMDLYKQLSLLDTQILFLQENYAQDSDFLTLKDANHAGTKSLVEFLSELGHTQITGLFQMDRTSSQERYFSFLTTDRDIQKKVKWYSHTQVQNLRQHHNTDFLKEFALELINSAATAVICDQDEITYFLIQELKKAGSHLPEALDIVSYGNTYYCDTGILTITSLSHKQNEVASTAAKMIVDKIKGLPVTSQEIPWNLIIRQSAHF